MAYSEAREVELVGRELIRRHHRRLLNTRVEFVFNGKTPVNKGREVWGKCRLMTGINAYLAREVDPEGEGDDGGGEKFFVVEIAQPVWDVLPPEQREALVDHELQHAGWEEQEDAKGEPKVVMSVLPHDIEEFSAVVARHGLWRQDVEAFVKTALDGQRHLFEEPAPADAAHATLMAQGLDAIRGLKATLDSPSAGVELTCGAFRLIPCDNGNGPGFYAMRAETRQRLAGEDGKPMFFKTSAIAEAYLRGLEVG